MAIYNEILVGRYARMLQKLFGIKGGVPAKQLAGEVAPAFPLFSGREHRYLESWDTFGLSIFNGAVAAQNSAVRIRNPGGSNVVVVLERVSFWESVADPTGLGVKNLPTNADMTTIVGTTNARLDPRGRPAASAVISRQNNFVAGGNTPFVAPLPATTLIDFIITDIHEIPLLPGDAYDFVTGAVNTALQVNLLWRERFLEESERT